MAEEKKVKIVLVDDEKFLLEAMRDKLQREGFDVYTAINGVIGLEIIKKEKPALILLDLIMPIKSGFDVLEELQKDDKLKNIPVIILSNLGQKSDIKKSKELGATDFLIKAKFKMKEVIARVRKYLK